ncbi:Amino acid/polyamine transporter 2 [Dillenia turbinata]|uniref:Amino acid/polyamine transporter 2 n=1 Tax=Dillenia turbinata TaxID=194707 RepID=A0AAN8UN46_9MAGN
MIPARSRMDADFPTVVSSQITNGWETASLFTLVLGGICYTGRTAIVLGMAIPLGLFLVWNAVILGTIPNLEAGLDKISIVEVFSLLATAMSYIGFVLGLSDFLGDLLKLLAGQSMPLPYFLTLIPPLILSLLDPEVFFKALDFAGTYGVSGAVWYSPRCNVLVG